CIHAALPPPRPHTAVLRLTRSSLRRELPPTSPGGDGGRETPRVNVLHQRDVGTAGGRAGDGEWGGGEARVETGKCRPSLSGTRPASTAPWRVPDSHSRAASECDRLRARSVACRGHRAIRPTLRRIGRSPRI